MSRSSVKSDVNLSDTNILSTFAKIRELPLLIRLFGDDRIGIVPAVHEELQNGLSKGYVALKAVIELVQQCQIDLLTKEQVQGLVKQIDEKDRIVFKGKEQIFEE